jgi:hypothetical protein
MKIRNVLNEPDVESLRGNLERCKSRMHLLLNVIMYAGYIDTRARKNVLETDQLLGRILIAAMF